jgi:hypothetical protein
MQATIRTLAIVGFCSRVFRHIDRDQPQFSIALEQRAVDEEPLIVFITIGDDSASTT